MGHAQLISCDVMCWSLKAVSIDIYTCDIKIYGILA